MLNIIKCNFTYLTVPTFVVIYNSMVRSYKKGDIEALEKVQKRATKILPSRKKLPCSERLEICQVPALHYRHIRRDMIEAMSLQQFDRSARNLAW